MPVPTRTSRRTLLLAALLAALLGPSLAVAAPAPSATRPAAEVCRSRTHPAKAAELTRDISMAQRGRSSTLALWLDDPGAGISCRLHGSRHFDSASIVKVTVMAAVLRKALDQHRYLTRTEARRLRAMITRSDNHAATALWAGLGAAYLQHFLNLAGMRHTILGPGLYWGLTQVTAHDEMLQLRLLMRPNDVLSDKSRAYALGLMAQVVPSQRWGVPAGAPQPFTAHLKNGWLPRATHGWRINSIGGFARPKHWYSIVVLSMDNPTMPYGIATIESLARVIHHDLHPNLTSVVPRSAADPAWGEPDEQIPTGAIR